MATLVTRPDVLEFLDYITGKINIRLEEILYSNLNDRLKGKSIRELEIRNKTGANIIGFKTADGDYIVNPEPDTVMKPDAKLFVLGTQDQVSKLLEILKE
jgi:voltage-gated potassium channel